MAEMILSGFGASRRFFRQNRLSGLAATMFGIIIIAALLGPAIWPYSPNEIDLDASLIPPGLSHPFGTDNHGRDVLARTLAGARISLAIGLAATVISLFIGTAVGLLGGFFGRPVDSVAVGLTDVTLAFPSLLLAIAISVIIPPGITSVFIALAAVGWPTFARLSRGVVLSIKQTEYFSAATASGCPSMRLLLKHVLPNCVPLLIVAASLRLGGFMLGEAALSFLGLGVQPPTASWGSMISQGRNFLHSAPWITVFPGMAIALTIISMNVLGDSLRDYLDP
jgi:peptide/nickel transport system permease protein